jgi:hypothetical protein
MDVLQGYEKAEVVSDTGFTVEEGHKLKDSLCRQSKFDHLGGFTDNKGDQHVLSKIHCTMSKMEGIPGRISLFNKPGNQSPAGRMFIYLESDKGEFINAMDSKGTIENMFYHGVIFEDEDGQSWFCGDVDMMSTNTLEDACAPFLFKVSKSISKDFVSSLEVEDVTEISGILPAIGRFTFSEESEAVLLSSSEFYEYPMHLNEKNPSKNRINMRDNQVSVLTDMIQRVRDISPDIEPF